MDLIQLLFKSQFKKGKRSFLIIFQLCIGFIALTIGFGMIEGFLTHVSDVQKIEAFEAIHPFIDLPKEGGLISSEENEKLESFYGLLKNDNRVTNIGTFSKDGRILDLTDVSVICMDKGYIKMFDPKIIAGRGLLPKDTDINEDAYIPALVGSDVVKSKPLNSIIEIKFYNIYNKSTSIKKAVVVGVLDKDVKFWNGGSSEISSKIIKTNNIVMIPIPEGQSNVGISEERITKNLLLELNKASSKQEFMTYIKEQMYKFEFDGEVLSLREEINKYYDQNRIPMIFLIIFSVMILLLSSFGLIGVILASIARRKREFGIHYALGATPFILALLIFGEILFLYFIGCVVGIIVSTMLSKLVMQSISINIGIFTVVCSINITLILSTVSSIIPIMRIIRTNPVDLITCGRF